MDVKIENLFFGWHEKLPETFIRLVNTLVLTRNGKEVREADGDLSPRQGLQRTSSSTDLDAGICGSSKKVYPPFNGNTDYRLLIVEF